MRFVTKFALLAALPAFVPGEPFPPLATVTYTAAAGAAWTVCPSPIVTDGDSIRCGSERVRLLGIDAPELGKCPANRRCVPGSGNASRLSLKQALSAGPVRYMTVKRDRYGRAVAVVTAGDVNLSCWQLSQGQAEYIAKWDDGQVVARSC